jgi:uncharacterized protein YijF (DUF1287 family)
MCRAALCYIFEVDSNFTRQIRFSPRKSAPMFGWSRSRLVVVVGAAVAALTAPAWLALPQSNPSSEARRGEFTQRLVAAAIERTHHVVRYDPAYVRIPYPDGDVPADTGVCTDEIIRSYRSVGVDLQKEVHEDMAQNFDLYPRRWRWLNSHPDSNIDHRRVPNLMVFFARKGESLALSSRAEDYAPGEIVTWDLGGGVPHVGLLVDQKSPQSGRYMIVHNIGQGPRMEDVLFNWKITGHYRYFGPAL